MSDHLGNTMALEGCDRCFCGCKYWENDRCVDCGLHISTIREQDHRGVHFVYPGHDVPPGFITPTTCGTCGITWDDAVVTGVTPAPSGRCPFEYDHEEEEPVSFDTGYIGAHRWAVNEDRSFKWTCVCGDFGNVASRNRDSVLLAFADHVHRKLERAAVALLADSLEPTPTEAQIEALREQKRPDNDKANLLQLVVNHRYHEEG